MSERGSGATKERKEVLVGEGLFTVPTSPRQKPKLLGSRCDKCGEVIFPRKSRCPNCYSEMQFIELGPRGKLHSYTNVNYPVPGGYKGPVPYGIAIVEMPEGARLHCLLSEHDTSKLKLGQEVELVVQKLFTNDEGVDVIGFMFKPV